LLLLLLLLCVLLLLLLLLLLLQGSFFVKIFPRNIEVRRWLMVKENSAKLDFPRIQCSKNRPMLFSMKFDGFSDTDSSRVIVRDCGTDDDNDCAKGPTLQSNAPCIYKYTVDLTFERFPKGGPDRACKVQGRVGLGLGLYTAGSGFFGPGLDWWAGFGSGLRA
jgi:hypothetical protein